MRVSDLVAPARAYPGDRFQVTGYVQSQGLAGRTVTVELAVLTPAKGKAARPRRTALENTERVTLGGDSRNRAGPFDVPGIENAGRRVVRLRVKPIAEDKDPTDNQREVDVDIVDRKNRVLLFAGGPSREYQFLRNMLRRSELAKSGEMMVDVLLQSANDGVSQDANQILDEFPAHDAGAVAVRHDRRFRSRLAGAGAGAIGDAREMGRRGIGRADCDCRAGVYRRLGAEPRDGARFASCIRWNSIAAWRCWKMPASVRTQPWPLEFTREGMEAEFLWLDDNAAASREAWDAFKGVYGYYGVRGPKLGATTYALYSDPEAAVGDQKPVYFAGQFYGSGRVFYMGSGEMWRLRAMSDSISTCSTPS